MLRKEPAIKLRASEVDIARVMRTGKVIGINTATSEFLITEFVVIHILVTEFKQLC